MVMMMMVTMMMYSWEGGDRSKQVIFVFSNGFLLFFLGVPGSRVPKRLQTYCDVFKKNVLHNGCGSLCAFPCARGLCASLCAPPCAPLCAQRGVIVRGVVREIVRRGCAQEYRHNQPAQLKNVVRPGLHNVAA